MADRAVAWLEREAAVVSPAYSHYSRLVVERAEGSHLFTVDGGDVLDFGCGIAVTSLGHGHPAVRAAVDAQLNALWHTSVTAYHTKVIEAAEALTSITPRGLDTAFFCNSGAEAIEGAIKLARKATGRSDIIAFTGAFHGRTYGALSLTMSKPAYREGVGPFLPGVHHVDYPFCFRTCTHGVGERCAVAEGSSLRQLFASGVKPENVAAIVVEPIQGEGGYIVPPPTFLPCLRQICDEYGILLIADEVQSGLARTGKMFAVDHVNVVPDVVCVAKALGNGLPIGAFVASRDLMHHWQPGDHGTTFGGNPIACAAAVAVIATLTNEGLAERSARLGDVVIARAKSWQQELPILADVRGAGLMVGLEFMHEGQPAKHYVTELQERAVDAGLLLLTCGRDGNVIRLIPPLTITEDELDQGLTILESCMRGVTP